MPVTRIKTNQITDSAVTEAKIANNALRLENWRIQYIIRFELNNYLVT